KAKFLPLAVLRAHSLSHRLRCRHVRCIFSLSLFELEIAGTRDTNKPHRASAYEQVRYPDEPVPIANEEQKLIHPKDRYDNRVDDAQRSNYPHTPGKEQYDTQGKQGQRDGKTEQHMRIKKAYIGKPMQKSQHQCSRARNITYPMNDTNYFHHKILSIAPIAR
ncbi:MAG: hypothetical protein J2P37_03805, partial [Ktedonobacteraceae bacterium]|nr:hypothetical protein [Ktedonobacteraceae bacterium]